MSSPLSDANELGAFLRARRAELSPSDLGLPEGVTHRRVAGLRREEVALVGAISTDYYTRLEQGRIRPSASVLASLARVLRLDEDQRTYLYELAGTSPASAESRHRERQTINPRMQRVLDHITDTPAIVMTPTHDILGWTPLAAALMVDFAEIPEPKRNFMWLLFTDPRMRSLYPDWEELARSVVAYIRMEAARKPDDPRLAELVGNLSSRDEQFRQWWAGTRVAVKRRGTRTYNHPIVGEITLDWDPLTSDADPDQQLIIFTAESGSRSEQALQELAAWAAEKIGTSP
jgi:transcriptional regulator with XRE-family HTH domain